MNRAAETRCRSYRTLTYLPTDHVADEEFGAWPQTIRRWADEGFPRDWAREIGESMFHHRFEQFIGTDAGRNDHSRHGVPLQLGMNPRFEREVLEDRGDTQVIRDEGGVVARWWKQGGADASIPEYLDFPVKDRDTWAAMKDRFALDDPTRTLPAGAIEDARAAAVRGDMITAFAVGFYAQLRNWVGTEPLSYLIYDDPSLVQEMAEHWAQLIVQQVRRYPADLPIHQMLWWEDMCFNGGPLISPTTFEQVLVPCYRVVMDELRRRGCELSCVDSDGNIHALVSGWMSVGINVMFPNEVAAGTDMFQMRRQWGRAIRFKGGINKQAVARGRDAIDRELERIAPLVAEGGYIPTLDHLVPPDISLQNYLYYRKQKCGLLGKRI